MAGERGSVGGTGDHELGQAIRRLRNQRQLSLSVVARSAGVSESFLSQVERGLASPSVASLRRIAEALGVPVAAFFVGPDSSDRLVRASQRRRLVHHRHGWEDTIVTPPVAERLQIHWSIVQPGQGSGSEPYTHASDEECVIVLKGVVILGFGDREYRLEAGDSFLLDPKQSHRFRNPGPDVAEILWVMTPPSY